MSPLVAVPRKRPTRCTCCGLSVREAGILHGVHYGFLCGGCYHTEDEMDTSSCGNNCDARLDSERRNEYVDFETEEELHAAMEAVDPSLLSRSGLYRWWTE